MDEVSRVVWIVGAGFSRAVGGPLLPELLSAGATRRTLMHYPDDFPDRDRFMTLATVYEQGARIHQQHKEPLWDHAEEFLERLELACSPHLGWATEWRMFADYIARLESGGRWDAAIRSGMRWMASLESANELRVNALQLLAAQCSGFLEHANTKTERWLPYRRWFEQLKSNDTVITFNYDRVIETLDDDDDSRQCCWYPTPNTARVAHGHERRPPVFKLHGSVDWIVQSDCVSISLHENRRDRCAAMRLRNVSESSPLATPGISKYAAVQPSGRLADLWEVAGSRLATATHVVFVGYRIPPTDAYSRNWLLEGIRAAARSSSHLAIHTVLGPDVHSTDSARLLGMLRKIPKVKVLQEPMFAEDFFAVFQRDRLGSP